MANKNTSTLSEGFAFSASERKRKAKEVDYWDLIKRQMVVSGANEVTKAVTPVITGAVGSAISSVAVDPFERSASENRTSSERGLKLNIQKETEAYAARQAADALGRKDNTTPKWVAFQEYLTDETRAKAKRQLAEEGGENFAAGKVDGKVLDQMIYEVWDESGYLDKLVTKRNERDTWYIDNIPTGKALEYGLRGLERPKNVVSWLGSTVKNMFTGKDLDDMRSRALDNNAANDKDLMDDSRFSTLVKITRALEKKTGEETIDDKTIIGVAKEELFAENALYKAHKRLAQSAIVTEAIATVDGVVGIKTTTQEVNADGKTTNTEETFTALTPKDDPKGSTLTKSYQLKTATNVYTFIKGALNATGTQQIDLATTKGLNDRDPEYAKEFFLLPNGKRMFPASKDLNLDQYQWYMCIASGLSVSPTYASKSPAVSAEILKARMALLTKLKNEVAIVGAPFENPINNYDDSWMFATEKRERLNPELSDLITTNDKQKKSLIVDAYNSSDAMTIPSEFLRGVEPKDIKALILKHYRLAQNKQDARKEIENSLLGLNKVVANFDPSPEAFNLNEKELEEIQGKMFKEYTIPPPTVEEKSDQATNSLFQRPSK